VRLYGNLILSRFNIRGVPFPVGNGGERKLNRYKERSIALELKFTRDGQR